MWLKSEGEGALEDNPEQAELQALYGRAITPFFDLQAGVRYDARPSPARSHLVLGVQGLLPYVYEIDAAAFVSDEGDVSGRFEAEYDLRINQRLVLQPRLELGFAAQSTPELGIGTGVSAVEGGLRLRYEIRRELAPYVGIAWERKLGGTADFARVAGEDVRDWQWVVGVRAWF
jgi:copper resistance protein B